MMTMSIPTYGDSLAAKEFCRNSGMHGASKGEINIIYKRQIEKKSKATYKVYRLEKGTGSKNEVKESSDESDSLEDKHSRATRG